MKPDHIRVLAVRQPWASLIVQGYKTSEIRTMNTNIRERIAIYASLTKPPERDLDWMDEIELYDNFTNPTVMDPYPIGAIIGTVSLVGCTKIESEDNFLADISNHINNPNWYKDGLYSWDLKDPLVLDTPIEYTPPHGAIVWSHRKGVIA